MDSEIPRSFYLDDFIIVSETNFKIVLNGKPKFLVIDMALNRTYLSTSLMRRNYITAF